MTNTLRSLLDITTEYAIFEKDQVLTHDQLNSGISYLDDETRLSRVKLLGVGIVCGLRVSQQQDIVKITKGSGITTDGDLLSLPSDTVFDQFKPYDNSRPIYFPFYEGETMIPVYELVPLGTQDSQAFRLSQFSTQTDRNLDSMVAVFLMESYIKDDDLCSGTDCDNLGQNCLNTPKVLLIDRNSIGSLNAPIPTAQQAFASLKEIVCDRPLLKSSMTTLTLFLQEYGRTCTNVYNNLVEVLSNLYPACATFLEDVLPTNPTPNWMATLKRLQTTALGSNNTVIQYYYDFLKDLTETYNEFRNLLWGDTTWCCPDLGSFPKHLLLGNLAVGSSRNSNRTGFYPSPAMSRTTEQLDHARFLAQKLNTLIQTFQLPTMVDRIRITPSRFDDQPLEDRAVPYYYQVNSTYPIHEHWNYELSRRGMEKRNYSYNASAYEAEGAAASPLNAAIGKFSFFRVEGHWGRNVTDARNEIEAEIHAYNLPFTVRTVLLEGDRTKVVKKPGIRYTDLHRFHYVLRQDVHHQLNDVTQFSGQFKKLLDTSVNDEANKDELKRLANQNNTILLGKAADASRKLNINYLSYQADTSWKGDLSTAIQTAGEFKSNLSSVVKTEFNTPFDSLISSTQVRWLDWIDQIIQQKDDKESDKLLFKNFIDQHPGAEHFAGVSRGGTLVLLHNTSNIVVADVMLPYYWEDTTEATVEEPPLTIPPIRPDWIITNGIKVIPSLNRNILDIFKRDVEPVWQGKLDLQKKYFDVFQQSVTLMGNVFQKDYFSLFKDSVTLTRDVIGGKDIGRPSKVYTDPLLNIKMQELDTKRQKVDILKQKAVQTDLPAETRAAYAEQAKAAEMELAQSLQESVQYIVESGQELSTGSDGFNAMMTIDSTRNTLTQENAVNTLRDGLTRLEGKTNLAGLKTFIANMLNRQRD
jgi:hypothetical protein